MTDTAAPIAPTARPQLLDHRRLRITFPHVLRFEWIKLISLRSTWITLISVFVIVLGFGTIAALTAGDGAFADSGVPGAVARVLSGNNLAVLVLAALGVLIGAREFSSGMASTTLAVVPKRLPTLWGKLVCTLALVTPVVLISTLGAFFIGTSILADESVTSASWFEPGVAGAVIGNIGYLVGIALIGVALGVVLRSVAGSIAVLLGTIMFLPQLVSMVIPDSWHGVLGYLPSNAASSFTSVVPRPDMLGVGAGIAVFCGWIVLAVVGAAQALRTRDA
jgi:hypothetical protein